MGERLRQQLQKFLQSDWAAQGFKAKKRIKAEPATGEGILEFLKIPPNPQKLSNQRIAKQKQEF